MTALLIVLNMEPMNSYQLCVAPMMDWTDRHCRYFHRLLSPHARLYTEMVTTGAVIHGDRPHLLDFNPEEQPVALQLGGSDPQALAQSARIAEEWGYAEVNLNVGCPSDRVQSGRFGACLMREPDLVADCVAAMRAAVKIPVTVKHRIGVDDQDDEADLQYFVSRVAEAGCEVFMVHARKAWLQGLSPRENRDVPPLNYERVYRLKQSQPQLTIVINGGIVNVAQIEQHLGHVDGVMVGRAAYQNPWLLNLCEAALWGDERGLERRAVMAAMVEYTERHVAAGGHARHVGRHLLGLYQHLHGARGWRRRMSEALQQRDGDPRQWLDYCLREEIPVEQAA
ncbi:MAG: tRNA dihydrouridine(20/20a) synthase DusA [Wenzhouxiangellaceae bacterium]